jgi:hypothetical protein
MMVPVNKKRIAFIVVQVAVAIEHRGDEHRDAAAAIASYDTARQAREFQCP